MDDALKLLKKWVIEEGQCVTKMTVLRRTSLNIHQIESLMRDFYNKHKDLPMNAVFLVNGKKQEDGVCVRHSVICKHETLEETKAGFDEVISVNVYSVHCDPDTSLQTLLNANWTGTYEAPSEPLGRRFGITCDQASKALDTTYKKYSKRVFSSHQIPPFMVKAKKEPKAMFKSIVCKSDQHSLKDAFAMAVKDNDTTEAMEVDQEAETSRKRPTEAVPEKFVDKKPKVEKPVEKTKPVEKMELVEKVKVEEMEPVEKMETVKKVKIEKTEPEEPKKQVAKKETKPAPTKKAATQKQKAETKKPAARKSEPKKKAPQSKQPKLKLQPIPPASKDPSPPINETPKDPFSSESDASNSDDDVPIQRQRTVRKAFIDSDDEEEKPVRSESPADVPRAKFDEDSDVDDQKEDSDSSGRDEDSNPDDNKEDVPPSETASQPAPGKVFVKKEVTETFTDEDGMLVTQVVSKLVEVDEPDSVEQKPAVPLKPRNAVAAKKPPKKLPANQTSISSFFNKK